MVISMKMETYLVFYECLFHYRVLNQPAHSCFVFIWIYRLCKVKYMDVEVQRVGGARAYHTTHNFSIVRNKQWEWLTE